MSLAGIEAGSARTRDGVDLAYERHRGTAPGVVFVHATGFCKEVWRTVSARLGGDVSWVAIDQPGHGDSQRPESPVHWSMIGRGVADVLDSVGAHRIGVGHSAGAAALAMVELAAPGTFDYLILIEPIIFPPPHERHDHSPLAQLALKRRTRFVDRCAAIDNFTGKGPFERWDAHALADYVDGGLRSDAGDLVLKCDPEMEAEFYRGGADHDTWDRLGDLLAPVALVVGADSTTHRGRYLDDLVARFPIADLVVVEDATHFLPMERPVLVADLIDDVVRGGSIVAR